MSDTKERTAIKRHWKKAAKRARTSKGYECLICGLVSRGQGPGWRHHRDTHLEEAA